MAKAKGLPNQFRLGKLKAKKDPRNLKFGDIFTSTLTLPDKHDFDIRHPNIPTPKFLNNDLSCCVIAGRAHQTLRLKFIQFGTLPDISDRDVERQYFAESGGRDTGLILLDSLKSWRNDGWKVGRRKFRISAFAQIDVHDHEQIKAAIFADVGIGIGLLLPNNAISEFNFGEGWNDTSGARNPQNGHYVYVSGYTEDGVVCVTWGNKHHISWDYFDKYCDEAYAIIDDLSDAPEGVDESAVRQALDEV